VGSAERDQAWLSDGHYEVVEGGAESVPAGTSVAMS
jgi:hypothetical protein